MLMSCHLQDLLLDLSSLLLLLFYSFSSLDGKEIIKWNFNLLYIRLVAVLCYQCESHALLLLLSFCLGLCRVCDLILNLGEGY